MPKATNETTPNPASITRRQAVAGAVALPALAALPVVAAAAGDPDHGLRKRFPESMSADEVNAAYADLLRMIGGAA